MATTPQSTPTYRYVDRVDVIETFIDSFHMLTYDSGNFRLELTVRRPDELKPPGAPGVQQVTACRLVIPYPAFLELTQRFNQILSQIQQAAKQPQTDPQQGPKSN